MYYYEIHSKGNLYLYKFQSMDKLNLQYSTVKNIDKTTYDKLNIPVLTCTKKDLSNFNWTKAQTLQYYYMYYYTQTLYSEIHNCDQPWQWDYCSNYQDMHEEHTEQGFLGLNHVRDNPFINNNLSGLVKDILENGMFFPFYTYYNVVTHGVHRLYALKNANVNKKFLFINMKNTACDKYEMDYEKFKEKNLQPIFQPVPFFFLAEDFKSVYKIEVNSKEMISNCATIMNDNFASLFFYYRDTISPLNIFNDEAAWDTFINSPFPHIKEMDCFD